MFQPSQLSAGDSSKSGSGVIVVDAAAMKETEAAASAAQQPTVAYIKVSYVMYIPPTPLHYSAESHSQGLVCLSAECFFPLYSPLVSAKNCLTVTFVQCFGSVEISTSD